MFLRVYRSTVITRFVRDGAIMYEYILFLLKGVRFMMAIRWKVRGERQTASFRKRLLFLEAERTAPSSTLPR